MTASTFRALHQGRVVGDPLVLPGPWDAASAQALADAASPPSAGIAASLGYEDGSTPPDEMFAAVARIVRAVPVPVSADIEGGLWPRPRGTGRAAPEDGRRRLQSGGLREAHYAQGPSAARGLAGRGTGGGG
jgi:hypothetical protein